MGRKELFWEGKKEKEQSLEHLPQKLEVETGAGKEGFVLQHWLPTRGWEFLVASLLTSIS